MTNPTNYGRIHNFGAGPAVLPLSVVEEVRDALPNLNGSGLGLLEISHRSKTFQAVLDSAVARVRRVLNVPADYSILFLQGGASLQFYMTALNLLHPGDAADFLITGVWAQKALKEAKRVGDAKAIWDDAPNNFKRVPQDADYTVRDAAVYLHYTTNNTIYGTEFHHLPQSGGKPRVLDASSDIAGVPLDVASHDLIYAGAQKNLGPSGLTLAILSPWALARGAAGLPAMLDYKVHEKDGSLYNTPNAFGIFVLERVFAWMEANGGLAGAIVRNREKAGTLYAELDRTAFWRPHASVESRSVMNVTWRLPSEALEETFVKEAKAAGFDGLKGHRSVGGIRASLYNASTLDSVQSLAAFMRDFEGRHG
ncbi:MAG: 3-phosphoserine/phosphohydroxythreonine transaminase [Pseudomonadota bacterium]|nr:3-phosphoserine/phosphohydroxythreonine transaminase [Pseudomonadota bacterium]